MSTITAASKAPRLVPDRWLVAPARHTRVRHGWVQTPVCRYQHPDTGRTVTVVATSQTGEPDYYTTVHAEVERLRGAGAQVVCDRRLLSNDPASVLDVDDDEGATLDALADAAAATAAGATGLGWTTRLAALHAPDSWHGAGHDPLEALWLGGLLPTRDRARQWLRAIRFDHTGSIDTVRYRHLVSLGYRLESWLTRLTPLPHQQSELAQHRVRVLLDATDTMVGDAVLVCDRPDLTYLHQRLTGSGHRLAGRSWISVGRLPALARTLAFAAHATRRITLVMTAMVAANLALTQLILLLLPTISAAVAVLLAAAVTTALSMVIVDVLPLARRAVANRPHRAPATSEVADQSATSPATADTTATPTPTIT